MRIDDVAKYLTNGRIVDLSLKVMPGRADSPFGAPARRYEVKQFDYAPMKVWNGPGEIMHYIDMENHISTHVECPSHFIPARHGRSAPELSEVPLTSFFGTAAFVDCKELPPRTPLTPDVLKKFPIHDGDIVLFGNCRNPGPKGEERCHMTREGAEYLLAKKVKLIGFDDTVIPENPLILKDLKTAFTHDLMLSHNIPIIERLANMAQLTKQRFFFFGFPASMGGLDSFPIRAVAIEGKD